LVQHKLELASVELRLDLAPDLPLVPCDPAQIEQVLLSFILNAIDAMPKGGNLSLASRAQPDLHEVRVEVRDDGVGIPAEVVPRLFEPFFTTKEGAHGLGLGLAISQSIIERHQGRIEVASEPGRGTLFTVILPTRGAPAVAVGPPAHWLEEGKQYG
jgi:signal transduction histidine kinase